MDSRPVWEHAAPPVAGAPLTFHKWRNDIMRLVPILGAPTLLLSTVFIGDLALPILQGIGEALALIYILPSMVISKKDSDRAYDKVIVEFVFLCVCSGMWMGSVIRLAVLRSNPNCSSSDDRLFFSIFGDNSRLPCIFSIIAIVGSSIILAGLLLWLVMLLVAMSMTPSKRFNQTWGLPAHRLARGHAEWHVDLYNPTDVHQADNTPTIRPFTSASQETPLMRPHELEVLQLQQDIERLRASIRAGAQSAYALEERDRVRELEALQRLNAILYPDVQPEPSRPSRELIPRPTPRRTDTSDPPPAYKATAPPGSVPPGWTPTADSALAEEPGGVVRQP